MEFKKITKTLEINAPAENVWRVLFEDKYTRQWYAHFAEGSFADTDWELGSTARFVDPKSSSGLIGKIAEKTLNKSLTVEYDGLIIKGVEDYESPAAQGVKGSTESYKLVEENGKTRLLVDCSEMPQDMYDMLNPAWDKAIEEIKTLSESL